MPVYDVMIKMVDYYHITVRAENEADAKDEAMALWPGNENEKPELFVNYEGDDKHIIGDVYVDEVRLSPDQTVKVDVDNDEKPEDEPARALKNGVIGYAVRGTLTAKIGTLLLVSAIDQTGVLCPRQAQQHDAERRRGRITVRPNSTPLFHMLPYATMRGSSEDDPAGAGQLHSYDLWRGPCPCRRTISSHKLPNGHLSASRPASRWCLIWSRAQAPAGARLSSTRLHPANSGLSLTA
jgi:hypothetical protein